MPAAHRFMIAAVALLLQTGCATHYYNVKEQRKAPEQVKRIGSPVSRAPRDREGKILLASGIGNFATGGRVPATLVDLGESPDCAFRYGRLLYTAGLWPSRTPATRTVRIVEKVPRLKKTECRLVYLKRVSVWERFKFWHDDEKVLGRALAWAHTEKEK